MSKKGAVPQRKTKLESCPGGRGYLALDDAALLAQCVVDRYRSHGPGGQKRNKTSSAVRLRHEPTGLIVIAADERSQKVNQERAIRRLREAIALNVRFRGAPAPRPTSLLAACITAAGELCLGRRDPRYYQAVQEILDAFVALGARVRDTAAWLGVSTAQLVKFFRDDPKLWKRVNEMRASVGAEPLR